MGEDELEDDRSLVPGAKHSLEFAAREPRAVLHRMEDFATFEVMDHELDALDQLVAAENAALGFGGIAVGAFISFLTTLLTATPHNPWLFATFVALTVASFVATTIAAGVYRYASRKRPPLLEKIRSRAVRRTAMS